MNFKSFVLSTVILFLFTACGYKPSSTYVKKEINGKVFVDLNVNIEDPKNSVLIKDAMTELLVHRLDSKLTNKKELADTIILVKRNSVGLSTLQYDADGYIKLYKATANINVNYSNSEGKNSFNVSGTHDFSIEDGGTISDTKRYEAIKTAANKALDEVLSKVAILSFKQKQQ